MGRTVGLDSRIDKAALHAHHRILRVTLLCLVCLGINMLGTLITSGIEFPLYLDCIGTVIASVLSGTLPGVAVGFFTNIVKFAMGEYTSLYYGSISTIIALVSSYYARKGYFRSFLKSILVIISLAAVGGILGSLLTWFIYGFASTGVSADFAAAIHTATSLPAFVCQITADFIIDLVDKAITVIAAVFTVRLLPLNIEEKLRYEGWQQTPLSKEMKLLATRTKNRRVSVRTKILLLITVASLLIGLVATTIGYVLFRTSTIDDHKKLGEGVAWLAANVVDPELVDDYLEQGEEVPGYGEVRDILYGIRESSPDILYVYVYQIKEDGCHVVFDLDTDDVAGSPPGDIIEFDESFMDAVPALLNGETIEPRITNDTYGWLLTVYEPVYDDAGNCVCYACADISMNELIEGSYSFLAKELSLFLGFYIFVLAVGIWLAEYNIIFPVNSMSHAAGTFAYNTEQAREESVDSIRELNIHTGDEIENLYKAFTKTTEESMQYVADIQNKSDTISKMQEGLIIVLADVVEGRDSCTGDHIKKTAAYTGIILEQMRREGRYPDIITDKFISDVVQAAPLHDIGKIQISDLILNKPGRLTDEEFEIMKTHAAVGGELIRQAMKTVPDSDYLSEAVNIAHHHHEKWNGKGYPDGLKGEEIPLSARVMAVADVFDALVSARVYKPAFSFEKAMEIISKDSGEHFDPAVAEAFIHASDEVRRTAEMHGDGNDDLTVGDESVPSAEEVSGAKSNKDS